MSKPSNSPTKNENGPPDGKERGRWLLAVIGVVLVLGCVAYVVFFVRTARPPRITTDGLDATVAQLIKTSVDEVGRARRNGAAWGKLGSVLMHYDFGEEARVAFQRAERFSPREARWPYLHALLLMNSTPDAAVIKFQRAVELAPDQPDMPRLRLAQFLMERGRGDEAETHLQVLLRRHADHAPAVLDLARLDQQRGRLVESSNLLSRCLNDPHTARNAHALLATVQRALGNVSAAEEAARRSASLPPDRPWPDPFWDEAANYLVGRKALTDHATRLMDEGRLTDSLQVLAMLTRDYPSDDEAWYLMGWAYNQQQQPAEAERALREHLRRSPRSPKGHAQLAVALLSQKRFAEAEEVLEASLRLKSTWRELHYNLGYACAQLGRTNEAISHLRDALERDPNYAPTYVALGELLIRRGQNEEARRLLSQALALNPSDQRAGALLKRIEQGQ